jgi:hypothetical protein
MHELIRYPLRFTMLFLLAGLALPAPAQTKPQDAPAARRDRVFLKDVEGIWINETYLSALAALKSPHAAARKTSPVVIAIRREGRAYPIVVTDFRTASLQAVLDVEPDVEPDGKPDGKPGAYRLVVGADDKPMSSSDVKYIRFQAARNAQGKFDRLRIAEPDFMRGKWADYIALDQELNPQLNRLVIAGKYRDAKGEPWSFTESGRALWPGQTFNYELSLNDPGAGCEYFQAEDAGAGAGQDHGTDAGREAGDRKRYGFSWNGGKLFVFAARLAGKKVVCDAKPLAVLTPE